MQRLPLFQLAIFLVFRHNDIKILSQSSKVNRINCKHTAPYGYIKSMGQRKIAVTLLLTHWSYCSLALTHRNIFGRMVLIFDSHPYPACVFLITALIILFSVDCRHSVTLLWITCVVFTRDTCHQITADYTWSRRHAKVGYTCNCWRIHALVNRTRMIKMCDIYQYLSSIHIHLWQRKGSIAASNLRINFVYNKIWH